MRVPRFLARTLSRLTIKNKLVAFLVPFILLSYFCMLFSVYFVFFVRINKYNQIIQNSINK